MLYVVIKALRSSRNSDCKIKQNKAFHFPSFVFCTLFALMCAVVGVQTVQRQTQNDPIQPLIINMSCLCHLLYSPLSPSKDETAKFPISVLAVVQLGI